MPRRNTAIMRARQVCGVEVTKADRWDPEVFNTEVCGLPKASHLPTVSVKRKGDLKGQKVIRPAKVDDHDFSDPYEKDIRCAACSNPIVPGTKYAWWKPRYGGKRVQHDSCPNPPRSFFTSSEILGMAWDISDSPIEAPESMEDAEDVRDDYYEQVQEIVDLIQEKLDNIESGFGHSNLPIYEELDERRGMYEDWAEEIRSLDFDQFEEDSEACGECELSDNDGPHDVEDDDYHAFQEGEPEFDSEAAYEALQEVVANAPE